MEKIKISQEKTQGNQSSQKGCQNIEKICEIHGQYDWHWCPECRDIEIKEAEIKEAALEKKFKIEKYNRESNIPKRFKGLDINKIDLNYHKKKEDNKKLKSTVSTVKGYLSTYPERLLKGASGFFSGECGTGKTMLACMMVENIINQGHSAHYVTAWQMIQEIRKGYGKIEESISFFVNQYINKSFLVIDEVGVQHGTDDERILLYQVIDGRYNEVKPTIIISNSMNPVEDGYLDLRTIDRLTDGGGFSITFNGESYRK